MQHMVWFAQFYSSFHWLTREYVPSHPSKNVGRKERPGSLVRAWRYRDYHGGNHDVATLLHSTESSAPNKIVNYPNINQTNCNFKVLQLTLLVEVLEDGLDLLHGLGRELDRGRRPLRSLLRLRHRGAFQFLGFPPPSSRTSSRRQLLFFVPFRNGPPEVASKVHVK